MPLQSADIRFARSPVMTDVANGGGPPTSQLIPDGASNAIFPDISEDARTGGLVEVRHIHAVLRNTDTDALLGGNVIVAEPPDDPNVSITLIKSPSTFARRTDLVKLIESTATPGSEFNGYLLENHVQGQRGLQLAQRPGVAPPSVNTSLVLVQNEGLVTEYSQFVRVRRVTVTEETRTTTDANGNPVDFKIQIASCELFSPLQFDFPGSPPSRLYARANNSAKTRAVNMNDAGTFFGASRLTAPCLPTDRTLRLATVYTQVVPNTRTESPLLDQRPAGARVVRLVDGMGTLEVTDAVHTSRIFVTEANQGLSYVARLTPAPAPGSVTVSYLALGNWYTITDDGAGALGGGEGSGTVVYNTGDLALTTAALPDYNSFVIITWASTAPYVNNVPGAAVVLSELPAFVLATRQGAAVNGATISWTSGGVLRTATASASGLLSGDATGLMLGGLGRTELRTPHMPDAGGNFSVSYASRPLTTVFHPTVQLAFTGGESAAAITLPTAPMPGTVAARWTAVRAASLSSGTNMAGLASRGAIPQHQVFRLTQGWWNTETVEHQVGDDGLGSMAGLGTVNYSTGALQLDLTAGQNTQTGYQSNLERAASFAAVVAQIRAV